MTTVDEELEHRRAFWRWLAKHKLSLYVEINREIGMSGMLDDQNHTMRALRMYHHVKEHHPEVLTQWLISR